MPGLNRLRELDREATPAPWHVASDPDLQDKNGDVIWPEHLDAFAQHWDVYLDEKDAELIVQLRNSFPGLLAIVSSARALLNAWNDDAAMLARARLNTALERLEDL